MLLTSIVLFVISTCATYANNLYADSRIVGGVNATFGEIPYIISLRGLNRHLCGGSILNEKYVLTAAHCVARWANQSELFSVQYGILELTQFEPNVLPVKKITVHENFVDDGQLPNDIAIVEIDGTFTFGPNVKPVKLPTPFENVEDSDALLAGWGLDKTGGRIMIFLQKVDIHIFSDEVCQGMEVLYDSDFHMCGGLRGGGKGQCTHNGGRGAAQRRFKSTLERRSSVETLISLTAVAAGDGHVMSEQQLNIFGFLLSLSSSPTIITNLHFTTVHQCIIVEDITAIY
ncbi:uncharacterized protein CBL_11837 [Carabus blaptoides fortunei]